MILEHALKCCRNRVLWYTITTTSQWWVNVAIISPTLSQPPHPQILQQKPNPVTSDFLPPMTFLSGRSKVVGDRIYCTTYVCSKPGVQKQKSEVQTMSKVQNPSLKPKSESVNCLSLKPKSITPKIWSLELKVWNLKSSLSEVRSKFFAIIITLSYNTGTCIIYCVFVDQL